MVEFFELSTVERLEALNAAASSSGRLPHLLEKDIWVVWSLRHLFDGPTPVTWSSKVAHLCPRPMV